VKFGIRKPSLNKRIAARTSVSRFVRHSLGFKAPRGFGWLTNPKRAAYNRIYNRTTVKADGLIVALVLLAFAAIGALATGIVSLFSRSSEQREGNRTRGWLWAVTAGVVAFGVLGVISWDGPSATAIGREDPAVPPANDLITISVAGLPPGAKIIVDGRPELSRFSVPRKSGWYKLEVSCAGYARYEGTFDGSRNADLIVTLPRANRPRRNRVPTRPQVERATADNHAEDQVGSRSDFAFEGIDEFSKPTNASGTRSLEPPPPGQLSIPEAEANRAEVVPTRADSAKWVDPFEEKKAAPDEKRTQWVDPFAP
jgi:hypothetical protein